MFGKPFCGLPEEVWSLAQLTDLVLERSGVDMYRCSRSSRVWRAGSWSGCCNLCARRRRDASKRMARCA